MNIRLVTPAPAHSRKGNRITAVRWARILRSLGHRVAIAETYRDEPCGLLIALHARRSHPSIARYRELHPRGPLVVALTGTDLYKDIRADEGARSSLAMADRLVTLQSLAAEELPASERGKVRPILQSVPALKNPPAPSRAHFHVVVVGHLRPVKDPFLAAEASRMLPIASRIRIVHIGAALEPEFEARARREMEENPRYRWLGELPRWKTRRRMAGCRVMVLSSLMEGGANVISEAIVGGMAVLSSAIPGSIGMLGPDYPGYFPVGDARALAELLRRAESEPAYLEELENRVRRLAPLFAPVREKETWQNLLREFGV